MLVFVTIFSYGAIDTASNGNWNSSGTWQSGTIPASGDTLVIPAGVTVVVNCNCGTYADMYILVLGTIDFPGGRKINMTANGRVDVFAGGTVTGDNGGSKLNIGGTTVWDGNDADITGPSACTSGGCGGSPLPVELLSFDISELTDELNLSWTTATETNNDYFTLSLSDDLLDWQRVLVVSGAGTTNEMRSYYSTMSRVEVGKNKYVRLTQTDFDGNFEHIAIEKISVSHDGRLPYLSANPSIAGFTLNALQYRDEASLIIVHSVEGAIIESRTSSDNSEDFVGYAPGVYLVTIDGITPLQFKVVVL